MRRALKAKLEYAKFLQQTLGNAGGLDNYFNLFNFNYLILIYLIYFPDEMGPTGKGHKSQSARDFVSFYNEVKQQKVAITNKDILRFSKLFEVSSCFRNRCRQYLFALTAVEDRFNLSRSPNRKRKASDKSCA
jgi:hypothetical protein